MPDLYLKRTCPTEVYLAHSHLGGWIFAAIGVAIAWAGWTWIDEGFGRWMMIAMGVLFALIGTGGGLWRYDLTLDLMARAYRGRRGFWPSPRNLQGSLSELEGVVLIRSWRRSKDSHHAVWIVHLSFGGWIKPVSIFETTNESKGYRKLEEMARLLQVPAIDRTGESETVRAHDALDRPVVEDGGLRKMGVVEPPPADSGIELGHGELGGTMIVLPASGISIGTVFLALFGLPFLGFGLLALASVLGVSPVEVKGTLSAKWIVGIVFTLIGLVFVAGAFFAAVAREVIRDEGSKLVITLRAFGRHYLRRELVKRQIEEIDVKDSRSPHGRRGRRKPPRTDVVLRTDAQVVRIASDQPVEHQRWLADSLVCLVAGS